MGSSVEAVTEGEVGGKQERSCIRTKAPLGSPHPRHSSLLLSLVLSFKNET